MKRYKLWWLALWVVPVLTIIDFTVLAFTGASIFYGGKFGEGLFLRIPVSLVFVLIAVFSMGPEFNRHIKDDSK